MKFAMFALAAASAVSATKINYDKRFTPVFKALEKTEDELIFAATPDLQRVVKVTQTAVGASQTASALSILSNPNPSTYDQCTLTKDTPHKWAYV